MRSPKKAVMVASAIAFTLAIIKFVGGMMTGSLTVISSSIDSLLDFFVSIINFFAIRKSTQGEDDVYHYGYGKIEWFAALMEGLFIVFSGLVITFLAIKKFLEKGYVIDTTLSLAFMVVSIIFTIIIVVYLDRVAKETHNLIIESDSLHYKTDLFSNVGIIITILIIKLTGLFVIDLIVSCIISIYIIYGASKIIISAYHILMDKSLWEGDTKKIIDIINTTSPLIDSYHFLKTRYAGKDIFIEFHLVFNEDITLFEAHAVSEDVEQRLKNSLPNSTVIIHLDPYDDSHIEVG